MLNLQHLCKFLVLLVLTLVSSAQIPYSPQEGDIVFQNLKTSFGGGVQDATDSPWAHVGVVVREGEEWMVLEAVFTGVKLNSLQSFLQRAKYRVGIRRMQDLHPSVWERMRSRAMSHVGKSYDRPFVLDDLDQIYCSELLYDLINYGFEQKRVEGSPMDFTQAWEYWTRYFERLGQEIPQGEPGVSPQEIWDYEPASTVYRFKTPKRRFEELYSQQN